MTPTPSRTHLLLIPSYNPGSIVLATVAQALEQWLPIWVVVDGSTDGSDVLLEQLAEKHPHLRLIRHASNQGKGQAVLTGLQLGRKEGFTHALVMDSDGQHPAELIQEFMRVSAQNPRAVVLGKPIFGADAPFIRVHGRKISNYLVALETVGAGIGDCLYGFRVYPIAGLEACMQESRWMRRFDFDIEAVVRLAWRGYPIINLETPVKYPDKDTGGVSHFHYLRDNVLLAGMHTRLLFGMLTRLPHLLRIRHK